ncbi:Arginine--pyruvate transaminase AruH [Lasiodiplodia theobromae]|nr:Arginine--pyruvate transaminase AruH [Lasiodiplodia theobromae]KAF4544376.1 Arginine--pyruvate transaminase AruH [Lasiodiplodia theobromae]
MAIEQEAPEEVGATIRYNLSESAVADQTLSSLAISIPEHLVLTYTEHLGSSKLRSLIAAGTTTTITPDNILVTAGASTSLFIVATALLTGASDHVVITRPNYATNLETPRAIGCDASIVDLEFSERFRLDVAQVAAAIRPDGTTKLISICSPNNPTGTLCDAAQLQALAKLARERGCYLLVDETYADLTYRDDGQPIPAAASLGDHVVGVSSMSKVYGVPGIRVGWLSTTNKALMETFLAAKEQISISGSVLDELVAEQILARRQELLRKTRVEMRRRRARVAAWVDSEAELLDWVPPEAGVMCFIRMRKVPVGGTAEFYRRLLDEHGAYVGPGRWFERDDTYFRLGFGWPTEDDLEAGLKAISKALRG